MVDLSIYAGKTVCVAVSGGRDSMALVNFIYSRKNEYGITLWVLNCDHAIRKDSSHRDSEFVKSWCLARNIPVLFFKWDSDEKTETAARLWRRSCYLKAIERGADFVATAHHLNDNAETVLFNLARGSALSGLCGITDSDWLVHPFIGLSRADIDSYVAENNVPYVDDETNFTDIYTRNKIRLNVLPELEKAVPGAVGNIYRFSRLAMEDEEYFAEIIKNDKIITRTPVGIEISLCHPVIFKRAVVSVLKELNKKDYTADHLESILALSSLPSGKKFEFLNLTVYSGVGKIIIAQSGVNECATPYDSYVASSFAGQPLTFSDERKGEGKILVYDSDSIPQGAVIRFFRTGDRFTRYGGVTKSLGDYFTDKKIPVWVRGKIPLVACGSEIYAVCGVEISDKIKITAHTRSARYIICNDYTVYK